MDIQFLSGLHLFNVSPTVGQVLTFTSSLNGQFACPNEPITYSCSFNGTGIVVSALPMFNDGFGGNDLVSTTRVSPDGRFTLTLIETLPWTAQLYVVQATDRPINVTCSDPSGTSDTSILPLSLSCELFVEPIIIWHPTIIFFVAVATNISNVCIEGLTGDTTRRSVQVTWDLPTNPEFNIGYYRVEVLEDGSVCATGNCTSNTMELEVPFNVKGTIQARVYTISRCNNEAGPMWSVNSISATFPGM